MSQCTGTHEVTCTRTNGSIKIFYFQDVLKVRGFPWPEAKKKKGKKK